MNFGEAIASGFRNYVTFSGRASRSEFWYWTLFAILVAIASGIIDRALIESEYGLLQPLTSLALLLPGLAVAARRLHDLNQSAWWLLLYVFILGAYSAVAKRNGPCFRKLRLTMRRSSLRSPRTPACALLVET